MVTAWDHLPGARSYASAASSPAPFSVWASSLFHGRLVSKPDVGLWMAHTAFRSADALDIDESVAAEEAESFGVRVGEIGLKDVVLPGEMRDILNQVVTAEKRSQANLIRRREGTAATRSLLNTVKLMEDNPLIEHGDLLHLLGHLLRLRRFAEPGG
jgi:regulator of protease activity HflC (stomatin/prohibitin superfamily)